MELKLMSSVLLFSLWSVVMSATADDPMLKEIFTEVLVTMMIAVLFLLAK